MGWWALSCESWPPPPPSSSSAKQFEVLPCPYSERLSPFIHLFCWGYADWHTEPAPCTCPFFVIGSTLVSMEIPPRDPWLTPDHRYPAEECARPQADRRSAVGRSESVNRQLETRPHHTDSTCRGLSWWRNITVVRKQTMAEWSQRLKVRLFLAHWTSIRVFTVQWTLLEYFSSCHFSERNVLRLGFCSLRIEFT